MPTITTFYKDDMLFETQLGNHTLRIDVPAGMGGSNRGPTPPELFIASLGSCVGAFVAQYCTKHDINTDGMTVDVDFDKASNPTRLVNIKVKVNMPNDSCHDREAAIQRVAEHCPVHETIETVEGINIEIHDKESMQA